MSNVDIDDNDGNYFRPSDGGVSFTPSDAGWAHAFARYSLSLIWCVVLCCAVLCCNVVCCNVVWYVWMGGVVFVFELCAKKIGWVLVSVDTSSMIV